MKQPIGVIRGTSHDIAISLYNSSGQPYTLSSGEVLRFGVKRALSDTTYAIVKEVTSSALQSGSYVFSLTPNDTKNMKYGVYYYDVGLQSSTNYYNVVECSTFEVLHNVTGVSSNV